MNKFASYTEHAGEVGNQKVVGSGLRNVSICPNFAWTAAISVLFSINFAVVFDFIYFRFRPSKAKWK